MQEASPPHSSSSSSPARLPMPCAACKAFRQRSLSMTCIETCFVDCTASKIGYMMIRSINKMETKKLGYYCVPGCKGVQPGTKALTFPRDLQSPSSRYRCTTFESTEALWFGQVRILTWCIQTPPATLCRPIPRRTSSSEIPHPTSPAQNILIFLLSKIRTSVFSVVRTAQVRISARDKKLFSSLQRAQPTEWV
jgi:hypothetical protein